MASFHKQSIAEPRRRRRLAAASGYALSRRIAEAMLTKKAEDVVILDLRGLTDVVDYFVIGSGSSDLQVKAIADAIEEEVHKHLGEKPWHIEGYSNRQWVLLDYVNVVAHVFYAPVRAYYNLERIWGDAPVERVPESPTAREPNP
ncbi:MAG: ribosome silencing factor [Bacteroidetes bacterium]|nr:ribosome silencing factor [Bacteroidota bacterium]MDW8137262.1 ribosome silencing factor [Bacteroidota bacterium]